MIPRVQFRLRFSRGDDIAVGPGKVDLLEAIEASGSISAAGRALGMSYRRAWLLVDTMNRCFRAPLVETRPGAGARVTEAGRAALAAYRGLSAQVESGASGPDFATLEAAIRQRPES